MAFAGRSYGSEKPTAPVRDPFAVLGVPPTASRKELVEAYRALARKYHPDRHAGASEGRRRHAERRMRQVNEAYRAAKTRPPPAIYRGTSTVPNAALWLGTAPGTWARTARRSGPTAPVTEEERRVARAQLAEAASEHDARTRVAREIRLQVEQQAGVGKARSRAKVPPRHGARPAQVLSGLGQAKASGQIRCTACRSLQTLPAGWQQGLHDTEYLCSGCGRVLLAR